MNTIASTIASARQQSPARPFGARVLVKAEPKPAGTSLFSICSDTPDVKRQIAQSKYASWFESLQPGQAIKMRSEDVMRVATSLSKWAKTNRPDCYVKHKQNYPGDKSKTRGRVWLLPKDDARTP